MSSVDNRIVEMQFKNSEFERGIKTSTKSLDTLKKSLELKDAGKSFEALQRASQNVSFARLADSVDLISKRFSTLGIMGVTALQNITNSAVNATKSFIKSVSVDQITTGFSKYEEKIRSVQTIMNATGKSVNEVNAYLDRLMWFSDETSYGFNDMTGAIAQMTSGGGDIEKLIPLVTGLASAVAFAGKGAAEYSRAMFNVNQSYTQGYLSGEDYKSLELAGVGSEAFKEMMIEVGVAEGVISKGQVTVDNFRQTLTDKKWANRTVMEKSLGEFSKLSEAVYTAVNIDKKYDTAAEAIEALKGGYSDLAVKAFKAAQTAKTFTEAIYATKDAVSTGWMKTMELIFGNIEEASALWSGVTADLWDVFASGAADRNEMLQGWRDLGGREELLKVYVNLLNTFKLISGTIGDVFKEIFPPMTSDRLMKITQGFQKFTLGIKDWLLGMNGGELRITQIGKIFKGIFSIFDIGKTILSSIGKVLGNFFGLFVPGGVDGLLTFFAGIGESISKFAAGLDTDATFLNIFKTIGDTLAWFVAQAPGWWEGIKGFFTSDKAKAWYKSVGDFFAPVSKKLIEIGNNIRIKFLRLFGIVDGEDSDKTVFERIREKLGTPEGVQEVLDNVKLLFAGWGEKIKVQLDKLAVYFKPLTDFISKYSTIVKDFFADLFSGVGESKGVSIWDQFKTLFGSSKDIQELFDGAIAILSKAWGDFKQKVIEIFTGKKKTGGIIGLKAAAGSMTDFGFKGGEDKKSGFLPGLMSFLGEIGEFLKGNWGKILGLIAGVLLIKILFSIMRVAKVFGDISKILVKFKTKAPPTDYATKFLQIAAFVALIVGAIYAITLMAKDPNFGLAIAVVGGIMGVLALFMLLNAGLQKLPKAGPANSMGLSMMAMAASVVLIIFAVKQVQEMLGGLDEGEDAWKKYGPALAVVGGVLVSLMLLNRLFGGGKGTQGNWASILAIAASVWIIVKAITPLGDLSETQLQKIQSSLFVLSLCIGGMLAVSKIGAGKAKIAGIIKLALGIWLLIKVLEPLADYPTDRLEKMGWILAAVAGAIALITKASSGMSAGAGFGALMTMAGVGGVIFVLGDALSKMKSTDIGKIKAFTEGLAWMMGSAGVGTGLLGFAKQSPILAGLGSLISNASLAGVVWALGDALSKVVDVDSGKITAFTKGVASLIGIEGGITGILAFKKELTLLPAISTIIGEAGLAGVVLALGVALSLLATIDSDKITKFTEGAALLIGTQNGSIGILSLKKDLGLMPAISLLIGDAGLAGVVWVLGETLTKLVTVDTEKITAFTDGAKQLLDGMAVLVGIVTAGAIFGVSGTVLSSLSVMGAIALVAAGFTALMKNEDFKAFINDGATSFGSTIGTFLGSLKASDTIAFAEGLAGFNDISVDSAAVQRAIDAAGLLKKFSEVLTSENEQLLFEFNMGALSEGITKFSSGITSLSTALSTIKVPILFWVQSQIAVLVAKAIVKFIDDLTATGIKTKAEAGAAYISTITTSSILTINMQNFADGLSAIAGSLKLTEGLGIEALATSAISAVSAIAKFLSDLALPTNEIKLPATTPWWASIWGAENSSENLSSNISAFSKGLKPVVDAMNGIEVGEFSGQTGEAVDAVKKIGAFLNELSGGGLANLSGGFVFESAFGTLVTEMPLLGSAIKVFNENLSGVNSGRFSLFVLSLSAFTASLSTLTYTTAPEAIEKIKSAIAELSKLLASDLTEGVALGIQNGTDGVTTAIDSLCNLSVWTIDAYYGKFVTSAFNLVQGLASGIAKYTYLATSAAKVLANKVQEAFNNAELIESPSKLMADSGRNLVLGLAGGINDNASVAVRAAENLASAVNGSFAKVDIAAGMENAKLLAGAGATDFKYTGGGTVINKIFGDLSNIATDVNKKLTDAAKSSNVIEATLAQEALNKTGATKTLWDYLFGTSDDTGSKPVVDGNKSTKKSNGIGGSNAVIQTAQIAERINRMETVGRGPTQYQELSHLGEKLDKLGQAVSNMKIVMDSGVVVGQIAPKMDRQLGKNAIYAGRG